MNHQLQESEGTHVFLSTNVNSLCKSCQFSLLECILMYIIPNMKNLFFGLSNQNENHAKEILTSVTSLYFTSVTSLYITSVTG